MELEMGKVVPTRDNPRAIDPKSADILELAESIREMGLLQPVLVRPDPKKKGFFDLRAGARRHAAHVALKAKTIRALVVDMTEEEAAGATVLENLQRENLKPLEEAAAVKLLVAKGESLRTVAKKVGKSHQWVARRARVADLIPEWKERAREFELPVTALDLVARYEPEMQKTLFGEVDEWTCETNPWVARDIEEACQRICRALATAPWMNENGVFKKTCELCKKRSAAKPELFHDTEEAAAIAKADRCLDAKCWGEKTASFVDVQRGDLRKKHADLVEVSNAGYGTKKPAGAVSRYDVDVVKKSTKGALPALVVDGPDAGKVQWVTKRGSLGGEALKPAGPKSLEAKQDELKRKRWAETVRRFMGILQGTAVTALVGNPTETALMLAATFGTQSLDAEWSDFKSVKQKILKLQKQDTIEAAAEMLWEETRAVIADTLKYFGPVTQFSDERIAHARETAKIVSFDLEQLLKVVSQEKGFTEPKSWGE